MAKPKFLNEVDAAIADFIAHGFDSRKRLDEWLSKLRTTAHTVLVPEKALTRTLQSSLQQTYNSTLKALPKTQPGVSKFTIEKLEPRLRGLLAQRIAASADLIRLNRQSAVADVLRRFAGWAMSIPAGGTEVPEKQDTTRMRRGIASLPLQERRVHIDQGHKLNAAINDLVATDGGAIAMRWHHVAEGPPEYDARPDHVARDGKIYLVRDSWADKGKLVKLVHGYTDEITQPAEEPFCRCSGVYLHTLNDLPKDMLTARGKEWLLEAKARLKRAS